MYISEAKKDEAHKRLIGTCKFLGIFTPDGASADLPSLIRTAILGQSTDEEVAIGTATMIDTMILGL